MYVGFTEIPEFDELFSEETVFAVLSHNERSVNSKAIVKDVFESLMTRDKSVIADTLLTLMARLDTEG